VYRLGPPSGLFRATSFEGGRGFHIHSRWPAALEKSHGRYCEHELSENVREIQLTWMCLESGWSTASSASAVQELSLWLGRQFSYGPSPSVAVSDSTGRGAAVRS
jgi:hypothetical protein